MSGKDNMISFWRVVFTFLIVLFHIFAQYNVGSCWGISVEFFFIVSGWLLMAEVHKNKLEPYEYLWKRIKRLYPEYLPMFIINAICMFLLGNYSHGNFIWWIKGTGLREALMIHYWPWGEALDLANGATWYISIMLIAGLILYSLAKRCPKILMEIILPITIISFLTYTFREHRSFQYDEIIGIFHIRFFRGLTDMGIGMLLYELNGKIGEKLRKTAVYIAGFAALAFVSVVSKFWGQDNEYLYILLISLGVLISFNTPLFVIKPVTKLFDKISYSMFLHHNLFCFWLFPRFFKELTAGVLLTYLACVVLFSAVMHYFVIWIRSAISKRLANASVKS